MHRTAPPPASLRLPPGNATTQPGRGLNALVLDSDAYTSGLLATALRESGCDKVWVAGSADAAGLLLAQAPAAQVDLIFCDLHLPGLGATAFLRTLPGSRYAGGVVLLGDDGARTLQLARELLRGSAARLLGGLRKPTAKAALRALLGDCTRRRGGAP